MQSAAQGEPGAIQTVGQFTAVHAGVNEGGNAHPWRVRVAQTGDAGKRG